MRHRKTACFEALVLELNFAQSCGRFLLLYCLLVGGVRCKHVISLEDAKCEIAGLSSTAGPHMLKE